MAARHCSGLICRSLLRMVLLSSVLLVSNTPVAALTAAPDSKLPPPPKRVDLGEFEGQSPKRSLPSNITHVYSFDLGADDFRDIQVNQRNLDVALHVFDPEHQPLFIVDNLTSATGIEQVPLLASRPGRYILEVTGSGTGTYQLIIGPKRKAKPRDRQNARGAVAYSQGKGLERGTGAERSRAEPSFGRALQEWTASGYLMGQADASMKIGELRLDRRDWKSSIAPLKRALGLYHQLGNRLQETAALNELGRAHEFLMMIPAALSFYEAALILARRIGAEEFEAGVLYNRGRLHTELDQYETAQDELQQALKIQEARGKLLAKAKVLNGLGRLYCRLEDTETAIHFHSQAMEIVRRTPKDGLDASGLTQLTELEAATLTHLGDVYRTRKEYRRAVPLYSKAIAVIQRSGLPEDPSTFNNLSIAYLQLQRFQESLSVLQHCNQIFERQGNPESAVVVWTNIGWVLTALGRYKAAFDAYERSLSIARQKDLAATQVAAYVGMAWAELRQRNLIAARRFVEEGLALIESPRVRPQRAALRLFYFAGQQDIYDLLVEVLMEQHRREPTKGYDLKAFEASERARSRSLLDDLEGKPVIPALSVKEIQQQILDGDTVLLEYFLGTNRSFLWVVTPSTFATRELVVPSRIRGLAQELHGLLSVSNKVENRDKALRKATDLSSILFGSIAKDIAGKRILIVAPPALQYISLAALPLEGGLKSQRGNAWPATWASRQEIVVQPSATVLASLRRLRSRRPEPSGLIAVFADPVYSRTDERQLHRPSSPAGRELPGRSRLRYSGKEAAAILAQVQGSKSLAALGFDASREKALSGVLAEYRVLHFSAHGELNSEQPDLSALLLSLFDRSSREVNGYLRAGEISTLNLPADLVVLSACRSGLGREIRGEGLVGLTQAFLAAGASRVIVSLWDVDDQATAQLMGQFYKNLFSAGMPPATALRKAQEWMRKQPQWNAPVYWAGFVLEGEWR